MVAPSPLLPANATPLERHISQAIGRFNPPQRVKTLWNADTCPHALLPYLAWALSVDEWDPTWSEGVKRAAIKDALYIHQHKGTLSAIQRALAVVKHPDADVIERADYIKHNGQATRNGHYRRMGPAGWATYRVVLQRPITLDQAARIRAMLAKATRNCVHLIALDYTQAALRHNGFTRRDGSYTRGII